jgi:predicted nucleic acid-binding protein
MTLVVADSGPLRYLVVIAAIHILPRLYDQVALPPAVVAELRHPSAPIDVQSWARTLPPWITVRSPATNYLPEVLDAGESEAIALAMELSADLILLDEREGRREARALGLQLSGTIGVLERGAERGWIDLDAAFQRLTATNYRIDRSYITAALERNRARIDRGRGLEP